MKYGFTCEAYTQRDLRSVSLGKGAVPGSGDFNLAGLRQMSPVREPSQHQERVPDGHRKQVAKVPPRWAHPDQAENEGDEEPRPKCARPAPARSSLRFYGGGNEAWFFGEGVHT